MSKTPQQVFARQSDIDLKNDLIEVIQRHSNGNNKTLKLLRVKLNKEHVITGFDITYKFK